MLEFQNILCHLLITNCLYTVFGDWTGRKKVLNSRRPQHRMQSYFIFQAILEEECNLSCFKIQLLVTNLRSMLLDMIIIFCPPGEDHKSASAGTEAAAVSDDNALAIEDTKSEEEKKND